MKKLKKIRLTHLEKECLSEFEQCKLIGGKDNGDGTGSCGCACAIASTATNVAANAEKLLDSPGDWQGDVTGGGPGECWYMIWDEKNGKYTSYDIGSRSN